MKAFYIIHAAIIFEIILTILAVLKLQEFIFKIKKTNYKIIQKSREKAAEIQDFRQKIEIFNKKCVQKMNYAKNFDAIKKLIVELSIQGLLKKFIFPKNSFFAKMINYKTTIFWFLASFLLFSRKKA